MTETDHHPTPVRWSFDLRVMAVGLVSAAALSAPPLLAHGPLVLAVALAGLVLALTFALAWRRVAMPPAAVELSPSPQEPPPRTAESTSPIPGLLDNLVDPILVVEGFDAEDPTDRKFVFANAAARDLFRIQRAEGPLTTAIRAPEVLEAADEALFGQIVAEAIYAPGGAQERVWRVQASPLLSDTARALIILRDETEVRRAERTRADFLANASHELRTPLASLNGFIETLRGHARDDAEARERFLAIMHGQAQRMSRLIDDLMSLSRIELNEHVPPSGLLDLSLVVADALDGLAPLASGGCAAFHFVAPPAGDVMILAERDQVLQVIQNLAENALKYSRPGGAVEVALVCGLSAAEAAAPAAADTACLSLLTPDHATGQVYVALRVRDDGPGLAREHLPRLTERFYRVEGQKSGERSGTGLGLAIVKHIMNRHRGGLVVESAEGQGATFTAYFPTPRAASAQAS